MDILAFKKNESVTLVHAAALGALVPVDSNAGIGIGHLLVLRFVDDDLEPLCIWRNGVHWQELDHLLSGL